MKLLRKIFEKVNICITKNKFTQRKFFKIKYRVSIVHLKSENALTNFSYSVLKIRKLIENFLFVTLFYSENDFRKLYPLKY